MNSQSRSSIEGYKYHYLDISYKTSRKSRVPGYQGIPYIKKRVIARLRGPLPVRIVSPIGEGEVKHSGLHGLQVNAFPPPDVPVTPARPRRGFCLYSFIKGGDEAMRRVTLERIYNELQDISGSAEANPRLKMLIEDMRTDLNREAEVSGKVQELHKWWVRYRGLSAYIYR